MSATESSSHYSDLEKQSTKELLVNINKEDASIHLAVAKAIPQIEVLVDKISQKMANGGRLFYIGAGTSGRLGILDASECPPTYGVDHNTVIGIIAGGDHAIRKAVENAEDNSNQAWADLEKHHINPKDSIIGIAASGRTPYVIGGILEAKKHNILTGCITCNHDTKLASSCDFPIEAVVGPEFVTGSTRMKAGTAQKLILNMLSTSIMIKLGKVKGNKMVDMQMSNKKLVERAIKMVIEETNVDYFIAQKAIQDHGSVRQAIESLM